MCRWAEHPVGRSTALCWIAGAGGGREWPGIREVEFSGQDREGRAGTGATPVPRSESLSFWTTRLGGYGERGREESVASGTGWDRVGSEARMEGGRWDRLAEQGCTCVSFIGGGVLRSTCL